jgi:hypothetical protein
VKKRKRIVKRFKAWVFLRTMASDYSQPGYPLRRLGPSFEPHLLDVVYQRDGSGIPRLFKSARAAQLSQDLMTCGRPRRVNVLILEVSE